MNHAFNHAVWIDWTCCSSSRPVRCSPSRPTSAKRSVSACSPNSRSSQRPRRKTHRAALTERSDGVGFRRVFTPVTVFNHQANGLFDPDPVIFLRDDRSGLVNAGMLMRVHMSRNFILTLRVGNNLFILEHESFRISSACSLVFVFCRNQFIMSSRRS